MYQLDIIAKIPEPEPDGTIRIRPGESTIVRIDERTPRSSAPDIRGRPAEWKVKTIPALIIVIGDDLDEIFKVFQALEDPEDAIPFLAISSDLDRLLSCRAEGKVLYRKTTDCSSGISEAMQYLHEIIRKTEYCFFFCSGTDPAWIQLAGQIAQDTREQNTLAVLALLWEREPVFHENIPDILGLFHTIIWSTDNSKSTGSIEQIRDLCEATIDDIVAVGGRHGIVSNDRFVVRELLFTGGISYSGWHIEGKPDALEIISGYVEPIHENDLPLISGTYSILKIPWESTLDVATELRNSLLEILIQKVPARYPHQMRIEGYYPETEGQFDLIIWNFTGKYTLT
jgi:hypothetical protein